MPKNTAHPLLAILQETMLGVVRADGPNLSARQMSVLLICHGEDGPHTVRGLAQRLDVPKAAITRAVDRLSETDLVRRANDPADRRSLLITRTAAGASYLTGLRAVMIGAAKRAGVTMPAIAEKLTIDKRPARRRFAATPDDDASSPPSS